MVSTIEDRTGLGYEDGAHAVILEREGDKMRPGKTRAVLGSAVVIAMLSACGGSTHQSGVTSRGARSPRLPLNGSGEELFDGKRGGTLTVYDHTDFPNLDPGEAYDDISYQVIYATQRPLFSYRPNQSSVPSPDLASAPRPSARTAGR